MTDSSHEEPPHEAIPHSLIPSQRSSAVAAFLLLLIGVSIHSTLILQAEPLKSANDRSRWCTVRALLEHHTYQIDEVRKDKGWDTIDLVKDGDHFYSSKPPILATWIAGIVWSICRLTGWTFKNQTPLITSWTLLISNGLPMFAAWLALSRMLKQTMQNGLGQNLLLGVAIFATLLSPFSVTLNNHAVAAAGAMFALISLWEILRQPQASWFWYLCCGLASAWTCTHELPAALLGLCTVLLACRRSVWKTLLAYVPAACVPLAFFFITNWLALGTWKPAYADYGTEKYRFIVEGVPSYWMEPKGLDRNSDPLGVYIFHCLIGHHGLFSLTPIWFLLLIPMGAGVQRLLRTKSSTPTPPSAQTLMALRTISRLSFLVSVIVIAFYLSRTENHNYGGNSCGLRWAIWLTPLWVVSLIPVFEAFSERGWFRWALVPLFCLSAFSAWSRIDNPWKSPWIFAWLEAQGKIQLKEPRPELPHPLWTWLAVIPDVSDGKARWMVFENASATQGGSRMKIEAAPSPTGDPNSVLLTITRQTGSNPAEEICKVLVLRDQFLAGAKPATFLRWPATTVTPTQQQTDLAFMRGVPLLQKYVPGEFRYRKTPLGTDPFRCQHVYVKVRDDSTSRNYRCEIWRCEELPFGIAEVEFQVLDANQQLLHQERWQPVECEPPPLPHAQWSPPP